MIACGLDVMSSILYNFVLFCDLLSLFSVLFFSKSKYDT